MGLPREANIWESVRGTTPYVRGVNLTLGGCSWLHAILSIEKQSEGDGKSALMAAFAAHKSLKHAVVVDSDIDPYDLREVEWAIATRFQADKDLLIVPGARGSSLDPSGDQNLELTTKLGIDATRTFLKPKESFSKARFSETYEKRARIILKRVTEEGNG
jgi:UbiD family decarboxylase